MSTAVVSCAVLCRVCGVRVVSICSRSCVVGYPLYAPPSSWWWMGPLWMVGWYSGWKGGVCDGDPPV
nr:MAG TPA: hypothetical protein [Caudoviricetes sp.]